MATKPKPHKEPRVVFSLGIPASMERQATRQARKEKITRNAFIVAAIASRLAAAREETEPLRAAS